MSLTGLAPGTYTVSFIGQNQFETPTQSDASTSITVIVLAPAGTSAQNPFVGIGGDPINTSTGEYFGNESVDLNLGGPMPLIFSRYVASKLADDNLVQAALGSNRSHNFASRTISVSATIKRVVLPSGRVLRFDLTGTKWNLVSPLDVPFILMPSGTNFLLGHPHTKQIWTYDNTGKLTKIEDGKGNAHTLSYTGSKLTSVSDGLGRTINISQPGTTISSVSGVIGADTRQVTFAYTSGVLTSATDYGGHTTTYGNTGGRPTSVTRPAGNTLFTQLYDANNKVMSQTERGTDTSTLGYAPTTTTFTDPTLATLVDTYDAGGRQISYADEVGNAITMTYDSAGRRNSVTDRLGDKTTSIFHALSGLPATITNAEGKSTGIAYKPRTLSGIIFQDVSKITYPDGASRSFTYDAKGNITQITDELGKNWKYTFNNNGQVLTATNPLLGVTTYTYDANGNRTKIQEPDEGETTYAYDTRFRLTQITRPGGATVGIAYDTKDRITSITDERGKTYSYAYDNNDRPTTVTDPDANNTTYAYDLLDRVLSSVDRRGKTSSMTYNSRHGVASTTDSNGNATTYQYDARRRPVSTTDAGGQVWTQQFDDEGLLIGAANPVNPAGKIKRNHLGQAVEISDPLGNTSHMVRDAMQRVTLAFDPLGRQTTYAYDKRGLLISATEQGTGTAKYDRDALGHVSKITDPNGGAWTHTFLKSGRLATMTDPLGKKWSYEYDTRGRLAKITYPDVTPTTCIFSYDAASNVTGSQFTGGPNLLCTYDNLGRLDTADGLDFSYDAESNLTNAAQDGQNFTATYDDGGRLTSVSYLNNSITVNYQYDSRNRLIQVTDSESSTDIDFTYDNAGRLTGMTRTPGIDAIFTYDAAGRLTHIDEAAVLDLQYTLTPVGEVAGVDFTAPLVPAVAAATQSFLFGKAGQITTPGYLYDVRGRLTAAPGDTFVWDGASRLINADGVTLAYNGLGDVTTRTDLVGVTRFYNHYALGMAPIVYEDPPTGNDRAYIWTPGGRLLYSVDMSTGAPTFYHFDRVGSTLALTDATGAVTDAYAYGPYGEPLGHTGPGALSTQPFQYIGAYGVRAEGSLYQMRARYYDPKCARFLSRDPLGPRLGDVKSSNRYEYASQNPVRYIDPRGEDEDTAELIAQLALLFGMTDYYEETMEEIYERENAESRRFTKVMLEAMAAQSNQSQAPPPPSGGCGAASPPICKPDGPGTGGNDLFGNPNAGGSGFPSDPNGGGDDVFISDPLGKNELRDIIDIISGMAQGGETSDSFKAAAPQSFLQPIESSPDISLGYSGMSAGTLAKDFVSGINTGAIPATPAPTTPPINPKTGLHPKTGLPYGVNPAAVPYLSDFNGTNAKAP